MNYDELQKKTSENRKWDKWYNEQLHKYHYECGACECRQMSEEEKARYKK